MIDELFDSNLSRKTDILRSLFIAGLSLHEAGHVVMAEICEMPVESVNLPRIDALFGHQRRTETDADVTSSVKVKNLDIV